MFSASPTVKQSAQLSPYQGINVWRMPASPEGSSHFQGPYLQIFARERLGWASSAQPNGMHFSHSKSPWVSMPNFTPNNSCQPKSKLTRPRAFMLTAEELKQTLYSRSVGPDIFPRNGNLSLWQGQLAASAVAASPSLKEVLHVAHGCRIDAFAQPTLPLTCNHVTKF